MEKWEELKNEALGFIKHREYIKAEQKFLEAVRETERYGGEDPRLAECLDGVAWVFQLQGKKFESIPILKRSLAIQEKLKGPDHGDLTWLLYSLGCIYNEQNEFAEAEKYIKRAIAVDDASPSPNNPRLAKSLEKCAEIERRMRHQAEARMMEQRAQKIRENSVT
jgi:tetratricopeptide (TPR) repeat protein